VPINTLVYAGIPPEKNNSVSGIVNLSRNVGGSIGIAFVTTLIARRSVLHQNRLVSHLAETNPGVADRLALIAHGIAAQGSSTFVASQRALGALIRIVWQQAQTLAYLDTIWIFAAAAACMVPLIFLMRRPSGDAAPAGH
jgi:DHA2 family multidrug resistance protein